ncbi:MAG: hypothetical protein ACAH59_10440 [Pseudobdellovibrionaceae bacterium]
MRKSLLLIFFLVALSACGKQIEDFVSEAKRPIEEFQGEVDTSKAIKLSPGAVSAAGSQVQSRMTLTPTNMPVKGSQVEARLTINQNRVN